MIDIYYKLVILFITLNYVSKIHTNPTNFSFKKIFKTPRQNYERRIAKLDQCEILERSKFSSEEEEEDVKPQIGKHKENDKIVANAEIHLRFGDENVKHNPPCFPINFHPCVYQETPSCCYPCCRDYCSEYKQNYPQTTTTTTTQRPKLSNTVYPGKNKAEDPLKSNVIGNNPVRVLPKEEMSLIADYLDNLNNSNETEDFSKWNLTRNNLVRDLPEEEKNLIVDYLDNSNETEKLVSSTTTTSPTVVNSKIPGDVLLKTIKRPPLCKNATNKSSCIITDNLKFVKLNVSDVTSRNCRRDYLEKKRRCDYRDHNGPFHVWWPAIPYPVFPGYFDYNAWLSHIGKISPHLQNCNCLLAINKTEQ